MLSGPILRRVDRRQVCIWTAWSKPVQVKAKIFDVTNYKSGNNNVLVGEGISNSLQLGDNFHVALTIAHPIAVGNIQSSNKKLAAAFPTGQLLAYDIEVTTENEENRRTTSATNTRTTITNTTSAKTLSLKDLGLLEGNNSIAYRNNLNGNPLSALPTFFLQEEAGPTLNVMHGSCRKLHGSWLMQKIAWQRARLSCCS